MKIMLCDDDIDIIEVTAMILEDEGYQVITTINSDLAEQIFYKERPDLLLIDLWMPGVSGDEVISKLKSDAVVAGIPMIVLSASASGKKIAMACGADAFIAKPYDIDELVELIEEHRSRPN